MKTNEENKEQYFCKLVDLINNCGGIVGTKQLYGLVISLDKSQNIISKDRIRNKKVADTLKKIIYPKWVEICEDSNTKVRGRMKPELWSLKIKNDEDLNRLKSDIVSFFVKREIKPYTKGKVFTKTRKGVLEHVYDICTFCVLNKKISFTLKDVKRLMDGVIDSVTSSTVRGWKDSLSRHGIYWDVVEERRGEKFIIKNLKDTMFALSEKAMKWYGIELNAKKDLGIGTSTITTTVPNKTVEKPTEEKRKEKTVVVIKQKTETVLVKSEIMKDGYKIFAIGAILNNAKKAMDLDNMIVALRDHFDIVVDRDDIKEVIKKVPEYLDGTIDFGRAVGFKYYGAWEKIASEYNPCNFKEIVLARIGMSLDEVQEYLPSSELISKINDTDGIYKLVFDKSQKSFAKLLNLFGTFRGTDMILDNTELQEKLNKRLMVLKGLYNKNNFAYQAEL